jgi:hypothetical protein
LPLWGYGYNYPANQDLIPTLKSFLKRHPDVVSAAVSLFPTWENIATAQRSIQGCLTFSPSPVRGNTEEQHHIL